MSIRVFGLIAAVSAVYAVAVVAVVSAAAAAAAAAAVGTLEAVAVAAVAAGTLEAVAVAVAAAACVAASIVGVEQVSCLLKREGEPSWVWPLNSFVVAMAAWVALDWHVVFLQRRWKQHYSCIGLCINAHDNIILYCLRINAKN